jgi:hypothetical protein
MRSLFTLNRHDGGSNNICNVAIVVCSGGMNFMMVVAPLILLAKFRFKGRGKGFYYICLASNSCCVIKGMVYDSLVKGINDVGVVFVGVGGAITTIATSHVHMLFSSSMFVKLASQGGFSIELHVVVEVGCPKS